MFFDGAVEVQRYDLLKYRQFDKLTDKQLGFFWRPDEVDLSRDSKDFKDLLPHEQHIFTSNLKRQILLDTVQGRSPNLAFLPITSLPELETWFETWAFSETIHSRSYTHILRNVYSDPSKVFDSMLDVKEIVDCATDITRYYDEFIEMSMWYQMLGPGTHTVNGETVVVDMYELKKRLWLAIMSVNILEGVRFYVSFACSWAFAELSKMEGNAKIIRFIARDENLHLAGTQQLLKLLVKEDPDFAKIRKETESQCVEMYIEARDQEVDWSKYLFKDGSIIGLNVDLLSHYANYITAKRMQAVDLPCPYKAGSNPLPWTQSWIGSNDVQTAPQEAEISSYIIGGVKQDVTEDTLKGLSL